MSQALLLTAEVALHAPRQAIGNLLRRGSFPRLELPTIPDKHKVPFQTHAKVGLLLKGFLMATVAGYTAHEQAEMGLEPEEVHRPAEGGLAFVKSMLPGGNLTDWLNPAVNVEITTDVSVIGDAPLACTDGA